MTQTNTKRIVIITTAQPSTNPRMVKEYLALKQAGYQVKVLYSYAVPWALAADKQLFSEYQLDQSDFQLVGGSPVSDSFSYLQTRVTKKIADKYLKKSLFALSRTSYYLLKAAKSVPADLYIAHTLGALPAAVAAGRKHRAKVGFDAEDFHRGEMTMGRSLFEKNSAVEEAYFPHLDFFTAASPMITEQYSRLFPKVPGICINNYFPSRFLNPKREANDSPELKLWWFSQKIGPGRGLDEVIKAIGLTKNRNIILTLLGNVTEEMKKSLFEWVAAAGMDAGQITILPPVPEHQLFVEARKYDIGFAVETGASDNLKYCLANKIFTYLLAGNAIVFSDTPAQKAFLEQHPGIGTAYSRLDTSALADILSAYANDRDLLFRHQRGALLCAKEVCNWERESQILVDWVAQQLSNNQQVPKS